MTEQSENVEPPLATSRVQFTLLTIVASAIVVSVFAHQRHRVGPDFEIPREPVFQVDLNSAPPRELSLLPGVGPVLAERIFRNRSDAGPFVTVEGLSRVHGIGPKTLNQIRKYCVIVPSTAAENTAEQVVHSDPVSSNSGTFDPRGR